MTLYSFILFIHILGAFGYAAGTTLSLFGLLALRRARQVGQARSILALMERPGPVAGISLLLLVAAGLYLTATQWGWRTAWIDVSLGSLLALVLPAGAVMGTRRQKIARLASQAPDGPLPGDILQRIHDPALSAATVLLNALLVGIVCLMVVKPGLSASLAVMAGAIVVGMLASLPLWLPGSPVNQPADPH